MAGRLEQFTRMRRRPVMPLVLKHSWKRREGRVGRGQRVALGHYRLPRPQRSHTLTHAEFRAAGSGGGEGVCFPPGPGAPHLVLGEAELHDPLGHLRGAPGQEGEGAPRPPRTVGLELRPLGRPRPHGPRARLHRRRPQAAAVARPSGPTFPWQPPLPGGGECAPCRPTKPPASRAWRLCGTSFCLAALSRGETEGRAPRHHPLPSAWCTRTRSAPAAPPSPRLLGCFRRRRPQLFGSARLFPPRRGCRLRLRAPRPPARPYPCRTCWPPPPAPASSPRPQGRRAAAAAPRPASPQVRARQGRGQPGWPRRVVGAAPRLRASLPAAASAGSPAGVPEEPAPGGGAGGA